MSEYDWRLGYAQTLSGPPKPVKVIPSKLLLDPDPNTRLPYVPHYRQDTDGLLARWMWERGPCNPSNYDEPGYEVDASGTFVG